MSTPFQLTPAVFSALSRVDRSLGRLQGLSVTRPQPQLRKRNRARSVQASAAIGGNPLSIEQVAALLDGKRELAREKELREILNVNEAYERLEKWQPTSRKNLLEAHALLMKGLSADAGRLFRSEKLSHQVDELLRWLRRKEVPALIAGCVVHYELLSIHPFADGNGRVARLWQQVVHREHSPLLQFVPVESIVRDRQRQYYQTLRRADRDGHCTRFLEFCLLALADALDAFGREVRPAPETREVRLERARDQFKRRWFSRGDYLQLHVKVSTATASRDLATGVSVGNLVSRGARRLTEYRFG